ncbi:unnamed protein product [Rhizoctonia solani]|uniref:Uncharacterized protein n=1 Tax=Rhizoctonia solani TaxID=456999 RepID=A0A8H3GZ82_9AGAM|nr:unnamed protein product [Rhizoctonia solani]
MPDFPQPCSMDSRSQVTSNGQDDGIPRVVVLLYYLNPFKSQAELIAALTRKRCRKEGWLYHVRTIEINEPLEDIKPTDCPFKAGTFFLYIIYVTQCLLGPPRYQVSQSMYCEPIDFHSRIVFVDDICDFWGFHSGRLVLLRNNGLQRRAIVGRAFNVENGGMGERYRPFGCDDLVFCNGGPLWDARSTLKMEEWVNDIGHLDAMIWCLDKDISTSFFATFLANLSTNRAGDSKEMGTVILNSWLGDDIVCHHSNMLYMERDTRPMMWCYSPFQSRPLGKPLPDLSRVCSCPGLDIDRSDSDSEEQGRKFWHVSHNAKHGMLLKDIVAKAECSICGRYWPLPTESLTGSMHCYNGRYAAIIPYWAV